MSMRSRKKSANANVATVLRWVQTQPPPTQGNLTEGRQMSESTKKKIPNNPAFKKDVEQQK
jgi:hypothetical protein